MRLIVHSEISAQHYGVSLSPPKMETYYLHTLFLHKPGAPKASPEQPPHCPITSRQITPRTSEQSSVSLFQGKKKKSACVVFWPSRMNHNLSLYPRSEYSSVNVKHSTTLRKSEWKIKPPLPASLRTTNILPLLLSLSKTWPTVPRKSSLKTQALTLSLV